MGFDPARTIWIENEWYWRITEGAATLTVETAARDFVRPLLRLIGREIDVAIERSELVVTVAEQRTPIVLANQVTDRVAINHLISDLNRVVAGAGMERAFAIVVPRRYELCGVLLELAEL